MHLRGRRARWLTLLASLGVATPRVADGTSWSGRQRFHRHALRFAFSFALALPVLALVIGASASEAASAAFPHSRLEVNITGNGSASTMGEPEIAQNRLNPDSLYVDWTTFSNPPGSPVSGVAFPCGGAVSMNRGLTWQSAPVPLAGCADGVAAFGNDGTLFAGGIVVTSTSFFPQSAPPAPPCPPNARPTFGLCLVAHGYDAILRSTDSGQTWSAPVKIMGTNAAPAGPFPFAPGSGNPSDTFDRPWLSVDRSTGVIYAASHNIVDHETFITASTDDGRTFGTIYAADTAYPSNGLPSGTIAAAHGVLAVAYTAASVPGKTCPCVVFETSTDHGATFTPHVVPVTGAASVPRPFVAADPAGRGRFALTVLDSTGTENQVYVTDDFGETWHGPTLVGEAPANQRFKPWLSFGPFGQVALVWRTQNSNGSYDVWAAVGRDEGPHGAVFSAPVRVTSQSGTYPATNPDGAGDDFSWIIADHRYVHVGWGDSKNVPSGGGVQVFYSRIPLASFEGHR